MNILYITDTGDIAGGGEISLLNLLENLDRAKFKPLVALPSKGRLEEQLRSLGIPTAFFAYEKVRSPLNILNTARAIKKLCSLIRQEKIDLVHTNSTGGVVFLAGIACMMTKVALVSHIRLIYTGFFPDLLQAILSAKIICISERIRRKSSFLFFRNKTVVIYNGVNLSRFRDVPGRNDFRNEIGCAEDELLVSAIGTYTQGKGFEYFIKALALLRPRLPRLKAVIIGLESGSDIKYLDFLRGLAEKSGLGDSIKFLGRREDVARILSAIDLLVFPSLIDPFGRILIEAMASAKPVVAFNTGGAAEIVQDGLTGFLAQPKNYRQLAEKMEILLKDRERADLFGKSGLARCGKIFDIKIHVAAVERLYRQILKDESLGFVACASCGSSALKAVNRCIITDRDAPLAEKNLTLCRCKKCGLIFVNPQPQISQGWYAQEYFSTGAMRFYSGDKTGARQSNEPFVFRLELIHKYKQEGFLLDVGCASGEFLSAAKAKGWKTQGLDFSDYALDIARNQYQLDVKKGFLEEAEFLEWSFDVIVCGDILEHTKNPLVFLSEARRILKDDGILYLAVPDFGSLHYRLMSALAKINHKNYFVLPHHLYHFTTGTLENLLRKAGFSVIERKARESKIEEQGFKGIFMRTLFFIARIMRWQDRMVIIAAKSAQ